MPSSSLCESIHASITIQQQRPDGEKTNRHNGGARQSRFQESETQDQKGLNLCLQLLLVSCLIGVEIVTTFDQIFAVLFLQFFGVPVELVTLCGVFSGFFSITLLPFYGWISNMGSNVMTRKLIIMFCLMFKMVCGCIALAVCGFLKMRSLGNVLHENPTTTSGLRLNETWTTMSITVAPPDVESKNLSIYGSLLGLSEVQSSTIPSILSSEPSSTTTIRIALGIIAFVIMDVGMEVGMLFCRTFVLECVPPVQHTRVLVLASTVQSLSGMFFSLFNTLDISGFLGDLFEVDGTAASVIFLSAFLAVMVILGFSCSTLTGYRVVKQRHKSHLSRDSKSKSILENSSISSNHMVYKQREDTDELRIPLITDDKTGTQNYSTIRVSQSSLIEGEIINSSLEVNDNVTLPGSKAKHFSEQKLNHKSISQDSESEMNNLEESFISESSSDNKAMSSQKSTTFMDVLKASFSMSLSIVQLKPKKDITASSSDRKSYEVLQEKENPRKHSFFSKRVLILLVSSFLANGAMSVITVYSANVLNIGIYHGDPRALPGTDGNLRYRKGLRRAAWGNVTMYVSYAVTSLFTKKTIDVIGERLQYILSHVLYIASSISLLLIKSEELYFLIMAVSGIFRACVYTLTYVMGTKLASEQAEDVESASKNMGKTMALVGLNLPLHYVVMSTFMGPLMAATGSPWVSSQYGATAASASVLIFLLMYIVK